eukprot:766469-Hanusia_phi.AAC.2
MGRYNVTVIRCKVCKLEQEVSPVCSGCGVQFAEYFCKVCKLYSKPTQQGIYHCNGCGICRSDTEDLLLLRGERRAGLDKASASRIFTAKPAELATPLSLEQDTDVWNVRWIPTVLFACSTCLHPPSLSLWDRNADMRCIKPAFKR